MHIPHCPLVHGMHYSLHFKDYCLSKMGMVLAVECHPKVFGP